MGTKLQLIENFKQLGVSYDAPGVLDCCVELCTKYSLIGEDFVESWLAFSMNYFGGEHPTLEKLLELEKKEFKLKSSKKSRPSLEPSDISTQNIPITDLQTPKTVRCTFAESPSPLRYASRTDSGKTINAYNESPQSWKKVASSKLEITHLHNPSGWTYMNEKLHIFSLNVDSARTFLAEAILKKNGFSNPELFQTVLKISSESEAISSFFGTVLSDGNAILPNNVTIEGNLQVFEENICNRKIEVDMSQLNDYILFPGQVVVVQGQMFGKSLLASKIYFSAVAPEAPKPNLTDPIKIVVAAAPFNHIGNYSYAPLLDLLEHVKNEEANILIIIGPILDGNLISLEEENSTSCDYAFSFYYKHVFTTILESLRGTSIKIFYVTSQKDVLNLPIFPTKPLFEDLFPEIKILPDPAFIKINGLSMGLSSTDTLLHLSRHGITRGGNRLEKLAGSILGQQNIYPLYPSDPEVGLDGILWGEVSHLKETPHILILPSDLHNFIKVIEGCLVINPERLAKGYDVGGFFCVIEARPQSENESNSWTPSTHISARIVKI